MKIFAGDIIILYMCTKNHNHMMYGSRDKECVFCPFTHPPLSPPPPSPNGLRKSKFWKNEKITWIYYHFTNVYHKWQSYDIWFFRYGQQQTKCFVILDRFLPFYPPHSPPSPTTRKIKILKNWKNSWRYHYFTQMC